MLYRGIEYHVSQTSGPTGWKWIVVIDAEKPIAGDSWSRAAAVLDAEAAIAAAVKKSKKQEDAVPAK